MPQEREVRLFLSSPQNNEQQERILQALILNLYRQELATANNINLKPVILFKAKKTIKESEQNKVNFHKLIDSLTTGLVEIIRNTSTVPIIQKAFIFFDTKNISSDDISKRIKLYFLEHLLQKMLLKWLTNIK